MIQIRSNGKPHIRLEKVELESVEFNGRFNVYSNDAHSVFYLLTPNMMENVQRLQRLTNGKFELCLIRNQLHIAINDGRDTFEPPFFGEMSKEQLYNQLEVFKIIESFIEELY